MLFSQLRDIIVECSRKPFSVKVQKWLLGSRITACLILRLIKYLWFSSVMGRQDSMGDNKIIFIPWGCGENKMRGCLLILNTHCRCSVDNNFNYYCSSSSSIPKYKTFNLQEKIPVLQGQTREVSCRASQPLAKGGMKSIDYKYLLTRGYPKYPRTRHRVSAMRLGTDLSVFLCSSMG